ncbi:MAG: hypothetical protein JWO80_2345 [Bryobacterales bacterium]|nr:hypothetical protein [Bryobacterales bacterium]
MRPLFALLVPALLAAAPALEILPRAVTLSGPEARQQLLVEANVDQHQEDLTRAATWKSSNPAVVTVDASGQLRPVSDGHATVTAVASGHTATAGITVQNSHAAFTWSFRNHVIPVLTKAGCNQGACHGALAGKNGFKLTLRGYDPDVDYDTLTRQSSGRRVSLPQPSHSLMLLKPTMAVPHGGGKRFETDSLEYRVIAEWIASGAPPPSPTDAQVTGLEVYPSAATLKPSATQQIVVRARYSDGQTQDVTRWVKFSSSDEGVATVDDSGHVTMTGSGEAAITLYYASRVLYSRLSVPYQTPVDPKVYTTFERRNYIDDLVLTKWRKLHLAPSSPADDATFFRRAYLDSIGVLPKAEEATAFLADKDPAKRTTLIDSLLARDEYVDYWSYKWSDLLLVSSRKLSRTSMWSFYKWIRASVAQDKPWDQFTREIFTGSGETLQNGALNYYVLHKDPIDLTENVTLAFMGQRLTCARCHNHPLEKWTQTQYYQMANLFSRVGLKNGSEQGDLVVFPKVTGDINHPRLLKPLAPTPLDGNSIALDSTDDRRVPFAQWLTSSKNTMFSRSIVNRVWGNFMGKGIVDPIDDLRATNPASNEELLDALSKDFVAHGYDIKYLIRTIMNSGVYQLSSDANATNQNDNRFFSKYIVKRLPAEVLLDAMSQVTGVPTAFMNYPAGFRAMQLPDTQVKSEFLNSFGRPPRVLCDAAERSVEPSIAQALHVINGDTLNKKLSAMQEEPVETLFLSAYSRYPTAAEKQTIADALAKAPAEGRREAFEDMAWALLTSKQFVFNY